MKKLLNTLYVLSEDAYLALDGENVVVRRGGAVAGRLPLHTLGGIAYFGHKGASPSLIGECAKRGIELAFFSRSGRFLARIVGESQGNVLLREQQFHLVSDETASCGIARNFIIGKIYNSRWVVERAVRDHPLQVDAALLKQRSSELARYLTEARDSSSLEQLRGIEGSAARCYFDAFNELILLDDGWAEFKGRSRRPPRDPANALLSFAYALLTGDCASALEGVGLDSYMGFMHVVRPGRKSLALDLVEEFRSVFADRVVLSCINNRMFKEESFEWRPDGSVYLGEAGRRAFLDAWQKKKRETIRHPFLDEKVPWGLVPHIQALLLSRCIRGELDGYPPFMWK